MHYNNVVANKAGRRRAAGCVAGRCTPPPGPGRTTCDEYPFASTYGQGATGWYAGTGATTRCVSVNECNRQGGTLSSFYRSFGNVDNTQVDVFVQNYGASPWCNNPGLAPDADFRTGNRPPTFQFTVQDGSGPEPLNKDITLYEYRTAANRTILSLSGAAKIGSEVFVPRPDWQDNPKVNAMLTGLQDDDDCSGSAILQEAAAKLEVGELGEFDWIVERI
ncbi:hypothetical protein VNI00_013218 [Paramarasmius palmivorus]|uniref:Deoxyribonuclease NucA/NucB domain-containing protein n=1 Tax=Paramarasmius palmivorus TaxID=297713 RepID=A0AAW0BZY4_9AGAR